MDWASSEWKQGLTPLALQKVSALEEKIERLQKERQQSSLQNDCLKLALEKEKRKIEKEKQHVSEIQRELQVLADNCKDLEDKQQKLQSEIQNRDSRIGSLEVLLSQSKNENCKLQQLVNDVKDLRPIREAALAKREQKVLASKENSENILSENDVNSSLKEKISEQEAIIKDLKTKLSTVSNNENVIGDASAPFKTPAKKMFQNNVPESPAVHNKNTQNIWNGFSFTPAKGNREAALRHNSDSTALETGDEKLMSLQTRLKQLCQELDCQRHNFEASKNAMEQKFKEKENALKADLKYQALANADLDKELKEIKNKYQQETTQATKKIDVLTLQLKKVEQAKELLEKDYKSVESKISANEMLLKAKEEELKDLQKIKNACEAAQQSLQSLKSKIPELERKCKTIEAENTSFVEKIKTIQLQLDGSNNLVKEKDTDLLNTKKELEAASMLSKNLQAQMKEVQNKFDIEQTKLQESVSNEILLKDKIESLEKEQKKLNVQTEDQSKSMKLLQNELSQKSLQLQELDQHIKVSKNEYENKILTLEEELSVVQNDYSSLEKQLQDSSSNESSLKEKVDLLSNEKNELAVLVMAETSNGQTLRSHIDELNQSIQLLKNELQNKSEEYVELNKKLETSEKEFQAQIQELMTTSSATQAELTRLQNWLQENASNETSLREKLDLLEKEKEYLSDNLATETSRVQNSELCNEELKKRIQVSEEELANKSSEITKLNQQIIALKEDLEAKIKELETSMSSVKVEYAELQDQLQLSSSREFSLKEKLSLLEKEENSLVEELTTQTSRIQCLDSRLEDLLKSNQLLKDELSCKSSEVAELNQLVLTSKQECEAHIQELTTTLSATRAELALLKNQLQQNASNETALREKLDLLEKEKEYLSDNLATETSRVQNSELCNEELKKRIQVSEEELANKSSEIAKLNQQIIVLKEDLEAKIKELETSMSSVKVEYAELQDQLQLSSSREFSLKEKLLLLEKEENSLVEELTTQTSRIQCLDSRLEDLLKGNQLLKDELSCKSSEVAELNQLILTSKQECEAHIQELTTTLSATRAELALLKNQLQQNASNETALREKLDLLEKEKEYLSDNLATETSRVQNSELCNEELKKRIQVSEEELANKSSEIAKLNQQIIVLKEDLEAKIKELETSMSSVKVEYAELQDQLQLSSSREFSLKEKLLLLEKEENSLVEELTTQTSRIQCLDSRLEDLLKGNQLLKDELSCKSSEVAELNQLILTSKQECEAHIQELTTTLSATRAELALLKNQLQQNASNETALREKLDLLEKEKEYLSDNLATETSRVQNSELCNEELKKRIQVSEEELANKSSEIAKLNQQIIVLKEDLEAKIKELETSMSSVKVEYAELQDQLQLSSSREFSLKEKLSLLEKEENSLVEELTTQTSRIQCLDSRLEDLLKGNQLLKDELSCKSSEVAELNQLILTSKQECEAHIQELTTTLSATRAELALLKNQLQQNASNETALREKLDLLVKEKEYLSDNLATETSRVQNSELCNEELKKRIQVSDEELANKSSEIAKLNQQIISSKEDLEAKIQELERVLSDTQTDNKALEDKFQECSLKERSLKEKVILLEKEECILNDSLDKANNGIQKLEVELEQLKKSTMPLKEELSLKTAQSNELANLMETIKEEYELKMRTLENTLSTTQNEYLALQEEHKECSTKSLSMKEKLQSIEEEKLKMDEKLDEEITKSRNLESQVEELKKNIASFENELCVKSSNLDEIGNLLSSSENQYEARIEELMTTVSTTQAELTDLQNQLQQNVFSEASLREELDLLEKGKVYLSNNLATETDRALNFETCSEEQRKTLQALEKELSNKSSAIAELNQHIIASKEDFEAQIQELVTNLSGTRAEINDLQNQLQQNGSCETSLREKLDLLEEEKKYLSESMATETSRAENFESCNEEMKKRIQLLEEELASKSSELAELNQHINSKEDFEIAFKELEGKYSTLQVECADLREKVEASSTKEAALEEKSVLLEKKKRELNENLIVEITKTRHLECCIENFKNKISSLEMEVSIKSSEADELHNQMSILKTEYENQMQDLDGKLSISQSEFVGAQIKLKEGLLKEKSLEEKLELLDRKKRELNENLVAEISKTRHLDSCIKSLKKTISTLEDELCAKSSKLEEFTSLTISNCTYEKTIQELEGKLSVLQFECKDYQNNVAEVSNRNIALEEKLELLEKKKKELNDNLVAEISKTKHLESRIQELKNTVSTLEREVALSSKLDKLSNQMKPKNEYELKIQDLERKLSESETNLSVKMQLDLENEKKKHLLHLKEANDNLQLESKLHELKETIQSLEAELFKKSLEIDDLKVLKIDYEAKIGDLEQQISTHQVELTVVLAQLQQCMAKEASFVGQIEKMINDKQELTDNLTVTTYKTQSLELNVKEMTAFITILEEDLARISLEYETYSNQSYILKKADEEKIYELERSLYNAQSKCNNLENELEDFVLKEKSLKETLVQAETKNIELAESSRAENLEKCNEDLNGKILSLNEMITLNSSEWNDKMISMKNEYENIMQEVEDKLTISRSQCTTLEFQLNESLQSKILLEEALKLLEEKQKQLTDSLEFKNTENLFLESNITELNDKIVFLQSEVSSEERLTNSYENEKQGLEDKISILEAQIVTLELSHKDCSQNEFLVKEKLEKLEEEKCELVKNLKSKATLISSLQNNIEELNEKMTLLQNELLSESEKSYQLKEYKSAKQYLENRLTILEAQCTDLEFKHKDCSQNEILLTEKLKQFEEEKVQVTRNFESKILSLEIDNVKLDEKLVQLQNELSLVLEKSNKLEEYVSDKKDLENRLTVSETQYNALELEYRECSSRETHLIDDLKQLEEVNKEITDCLESQIAELNEKWVASQDEFSSEMRKLNLMRDEDEIKLKSLEVELNIAQTKCVELERELKDQTPNKISIEKKLLLLEKVEFDENLRAETDKTQILKSNIDYVNNTIAHLDKELNSKSLESNAMRQMVILKEYQRNTRKLQEGISEARSKILLLETKLKASALREELLFIKLASVENQLSEEVNKITVLKLGVGELKEIILALQALLLESNIGGCSTLSSGIVTSKICCEALDGGFLARREMECVDGVSKQKLDSLESSTSQFSLLQKFALNFLLDICALEKDLIVNLEKCQFLCWYQLLEDEELMTTSKIVSFFRTKLKQCQILKAFTFGTYQFLKSNTILRKNLHTILSKQLSFAMQDFLCMSWNSLSELMLTFSHNLKKGISTVSRHSVFITNHSTIHHTRLHLPVIQNSKYLIFIHSITRTFARCEPQSILTFSLDTVFQGKNLQIWLKIKEVLHTIEAQYIPFVLNSIMSFCESVLYQPMKMTALPMGRILDDATFSPTLSPRTNEYLLQKGIKFLGSRLDSSVHTTELKSKNLALEVEQLKEEFLGAKNINESLKQALNCERKKQQLLNATIEEIETDLSETFQEKEKFKQMTLSACNLLSSLKKLLGEPSTFSAIKFESECIDEVCFCESCVQSDESEIKDSNHEKLVPSDCLEWLKTWFHSGSLLEVEVRKLRQLESESNSVSGNKDFEEVNAGVYNPKSEGKQQTEKSGISEPTHKIDYLESENSRLSKAVDECNALCAALEGKTSELGESLKSALCEVKDLEFKLEKQTEKLEQSAESIRKKVEFISELRSKNSELSLTVKECKEKCSAHDDKIRTLSTDVVEYLGALQSKEEEIGSLKKFTEELNMNFDRTRLKCEEYENKIELLKSTISKYEEEKVIDEHLGKHNTSQCKVERDATDEESAELISDLQNKIEALRKSNSSLNLTIKNIEEDLQSVHAEKKGITEKLESLLEENARLKVAQEYDNEEKYVEELLRKLKEFENDKVNNDAIIDQLRNKNETLERDVGVLKTVQRQHEYVIFEKNSTLKESTQTVKQLQQAILDLEGKLNLVLRKEVVSSEDELKFLLIAVNEEKSELEEEIKNLKFAEKGNLDRFSELEKENLDLVSLTNNMRQDLEIHYKELEDFKVCMNGLKVENAELQKELKNENNLRILLQEDLVMKEKCLSDLNVLYVETLTELEKLKIDNYELSALKDAAAITEKQLQAEMDAAKNEIIKVQDILHRIQGKCNNLSSEKQQMLSEIENLNAKLMKQRKDEDYDTLEVEKIKRVLSRVIHWNLNLLNLISDGIKNYSSYPDLDKLQSSLEKMFKYWSLSTEKLIGLEKGCPSETFDQFQKFFNALNEKYEEELQLIIVAKSIIDTAHTINQFCESMGQKVELGNFTGNMTNVTFSETTFKNAYKRNNSQFNIPVQEMQQAQEVLTEAFTALKNALWEKTEEGKMLKAKLEEFSSKATAKVETKTSDKEKNPYEWKFKLVRKNYERLEKDYSEIIMKNKEMEACITTLEAEKKSLDEETSDKKKNSYEWKFKLLRKSYEQLEKDYSEIIMKNKEMEACITTLEAEKKSLDEETSDKKKNSYEWKFKLLRKSYEQLEKDYSEIIMKNKEMEACITTLEAEKKSLDEEAEELCKVAKQVKNDFYSTFEKLTSTRAKLEDSENEVKSLKKTIVELQQAKEKGSGPSWNGGKKAEIPNSSLNGNENSPKKKIEKKYFSETKRL